MTASRLRLQFLSEEALDRIEQTAYRLLAEVGIALDHDEAAEMLHGLGCRVEGGRVLIPRDAVEWALGNLRPHRHVTNLDGSPAFDFGDGQVRFHNGGGPPFVYDLETGERRKAVLQDVADITRLLDALPHVDSITPLFGPQDVPGELLAVASTDAMLRNTRKSISSAAIEKPEHVGYVVEMAAACCGGMDAFRANPTMSISVSPISPLRFSHDVTAAIIAVVRSGAPFHSLPAPSLGATAPITMAAALAQQHAEVLASFVIAAAAQPGALVGYCSRISPIDLRTAVSSWGGPEVGMSGACAVQLAHRLNMPCDSYGLSHSGLLIDAQFAYERFANAFPPALAGADILSGVGSAESGLAGGYGLAVIDNEMISLMKHIIAGCDVSDDALAFDVMRDVILDGGVFLAEEHTVRFMRKNVIWMPEIGVRGGASGEGAADGVLVRARDRARTILRTHHPDPLPDDVLAELDDIMARANHELAPG